MKDIRYFKETREGRRRGSSNLENPPISELELDDFLSRDEKITIYRGPPLRPPPSPCDN